MTEPAASSSLYARTAGAVAQRPARAVGLVLGGWMHALGHAFLAGAGGALARGLAGGSLMDAGSRSVLGRAAPWLETLGFGDALLGLAVVGLFAAAAKLVGSVVAASAEARVAADVGCAVRLEVLDRVLGPRQGSHGADVAAMTLHVGEVERGVSEGVLAEVRAGLALLPLAGLLVLLAPRLAGSAFAALALFALFAFTVRRAFKRAHARAGATAGALVVAADEAVEHAELWATFGATQKIRAHVARVGLAIAEEGARLRARGALLSGTSEVLGALALVLVLALAAAGAIGGVERGTIVPFAIAFFLAYKPLRDLVDARIVRARGAEALALATARPPAPPLAPRRGWSLATLAIDGLVAAHGDHAPVSIRIAPGAIVAIVGETGAGKTSLLRAVLGLDVPRAGTVTYGAEDLTHAGIGPGARPFAWVPQDAPVIGDSVAANVALGAPDDVRGHEAILAELGADLDTNAAALFASGGERQWIAVARALATDLPVLLLDEPTSALDAASQDAMLAALARLRGKKTIVLVTHRPEPLAIADVVIDLSRTSARRGSDGFHRHDRRRPDLGDDHRRPAEDASLPPARR